MCSQNPVFAAESPLIRDDLISSNCVKKAEDYDIMCNYSALVFERQEMDEPHNPYDQEIRESLSIENGDMEMYRHGSQRGWQES